MTAQSNQLSALTALQVTRAEECQKDVKRLDLLLDHSSRNLGCANNMFGYAHS